MSKEIMNYNLNSNTRGAPALKLMDVPLRMNEKRMDIIIESIRTTICKNTNRKGNNE